MAGKRVAAAILWCLWAGGARAACTLGGVAELPVMMEGTSPTIDVKLDGTHKRMIVDSGAFFSTLSKSAATDLGLKLKPASAFLRMNGIGGEFGVELGFVKTVELAATRINHAMFLVGGSMGGIDGLIGQEVLQTADVEYDLGAGMIRLLKPSDCARINLAYWAKDKPVSAVDIEATSASKPHAVGIVYLNGVKVRALFDTGGGTSLISVKAAARAGVKPGDKGVRPAGEAFGLGRRAVKTWIAPFDSFKIGDEEIRHTNLRLGDFGDLDVDMILGADFFLSHHVLVSNSQHRVYLTYNGGPVFNLTASISDDKADAPPPAGPAALSDGPDPTTADGFARRGAAREARRDYAGALADLDRAITLAPDVASYRRARAAAYVTGKQFDRALADLDAAVRSDPHDPDLLLERADLQRQRKQFAAAAADLTTAAALLPAKSRRHLDVAALLTAVDAFDPAIAQINAWIAANPGWSHDPEALNERCRARALAGKELDQALADCNTAHVVVSGSSDILDSRGLARLRRGEYDKAVADYNAALAISPKMAWALYGRGLAEKHLGQTARSEADIAAAIKLAPDLAEHAKRVGLTE